ncbi:hypothetical protein QN277_006458 [Acacia crassicarpa]|uniref:Protein TONSOKU n=1 Tax=Acacia crassicarpa TaxID=499986 RepID=A0AAE1M7U4_9FABA|nr:hypothetical protein QN277_006458 [Acacia crassicarpa]
MAGEDGHIKAAKTAYRNAKAEGNRREEARWANVIGDLLKNRGEYVEALKWLRIDYDISLKYLPEKHLLPTCQSLGEIYLRLEHFTDALAYQEKHLELARDANDLVEQQRASTQLGRTYYELFSRSEHDHNSIRNAKKYFESAMELAQIIKDNPPTNYSSHVKEYIDAHNNRGMLEMELDNLEEAKKILSRGLQICDEEEVSRDDDGRSRLHHNLGNVYMELRNWNKARNNVEKDIQICNRIGHCQGEAKGYINLGEVNYRTQKYEDALLCYKKALLRAKSLEDEDALVRQIHQNIKIINEAIKVMDELKKEEQNLKKLERDVAAARGTPHERKHLLLLNKSIDRLLEKSGIIFAWEKHCKYAKKKKKIACELCDKEKLADSYMAVGESYQKLREFNKAIKWYTKSLETYRIIGNLEGQALVKIDIGNVFDSARNWRGALDAFQESHRIAVEANLHSVQLSALENMHYSNMIRFDDENETRRLKNLIDKLKKSIEKEPETKNMPEDYCSETDTEANSYLSDSGSDCFCSPKTSYRSKNTCSEEELNEDLPLISLFQCIRSSSKKRTGHMESPSNSPTQAEQSPESFPSLTSNHQTVVGRKRIRIILSDNDDNDDELGCLNRKDHHGLSEDAASRGATAKSTRSASPADKLQVDSLCGSKCALNVEDSISSFKCMSPRRGSIAGRCSRSLSKDMIAEPDFAGSSKSDTNISGRLLQHDVARPVLLDSENLQYITFKIENDFIHVQASSCIVDALLNIESLKAEVACLYYLQLPIEKKSEGLLPVVECLKCAGGFIESPETEKNFREHLGKDVVEASIVGWVQNRLIKMYMDSCKELSEVANMKVLKKLYNLEVSDDEIIVSDCDLQDLSVRPLLNALHSHKTFAMLDFSHNFLGNGTMEKLQKVFTESGQTYGGLTLDLHCNKFGPTALFQICECPALFARLEVLNISGNRLTDACGSYLSTVLAKCTALCSLNVENCHITTRTIQKIADALDSDTVLAQLCIGYNSPVAGNAIVNLLAKLSTMKRFSELNLSGLKLGKPVVDSLCKLAGNTNLSGLMLGSTGIGTVGAMQLAESLSKGTRELVKLDLSYCQLTPNSVLNTSFNLFCSLLELNLEGNPITPKGSNCLSSLLVSPQCCLKVLVLTKCQLGLAGILHVTEALAENNYLEELNLSGNAVPNELHTLQVDFSAEVRLQVETRKEDLPMMVDDGEEPVCVFNTDYHQLEVADSEDGQAGVEVPPGIDDSCADSHHQRSSSSECKFIQQLSTAIATAKHLQLLDISDNSFSSEAGETLYSSWSSTLRAGSSQKHITEHIIHFSTKDNRCCRLKPCCKKY